MKKKAYYLFALLAGMVFLLASCEELDTPYNTVPRLDKVTVTPSKTELKYTLYHENKNANSGYYEISQYADMRDAERVNSSHYNGYWSAEVDLLPSTTYYIRLVLSNNNSSVAGPVTEYTTPEISRTVSVSQVTTNSARFAISWNRTDCLVFFQYSTSEDLSGAKTKQATPYNSSYVLYLDGLQNYTTYYVRAAIQLPDGNYYYTPVTKFTTTRPVTISTSDSSVSGSTRYWIVGEDYTTSGSATGNSWNINASGSSTIYVFKPYKSANDYKAVPIYYNEYEVFEWGYGKIDPSSSQSVSCKMNKWLAYSVTLNISIKSANGATSSKSISQVEIANAGTAQAISTDATFDVSTGNITPVKNNAAKWTAKPNIPLTYTNAYPVSFRSLIPIKFNDGEVKVNIVLNNPTNMTTEVYPATLPASDWKQGQPYPYNITLTYTRTDVEVTVGDVTVTPWKEGDNNDIDIYD